MGARRSGVMVSMFHLTTVSPWGRLTGVSSGARSMAFRALSRGDPSSPFFTSRRFTFLGASSVGRKREPSSRFVVLTRKTPSRISPSTWPALLFPRKRCPSISRSVSFGIRSWRCCVARRIDGSERTPTSIRVPRSELHVLQRSFDSSFPPTASGMMCSRVSGWVSRQTMHALPGQGILMALPPIRAQLAFAAAQMRMRSTSSSET